MIKRIVAKEDDSRYLILIRPNDDVFIDEARIDDMAILADRREGFRWPPWPLHRYLKFDPYWEECDHDEGLLAELLRLPERPERQDSNERDRI